MAHFVIHISGLKQEKKLICFEVPEKFLQDNMANFNNNKIEAAGWYYMNKVDNFSCTGPYEWCVMPIELFWNLNKILPLKKLTGSLSEL